MVTWMLLLAGVANVMEVVTFIQFIEEEAIQSAGLGTYLALRAGVSTGTTKGLYRLDILCTHLEAMNDQVGWLAPYSKWPFEDFAAATRTNIDIFQDILFARLAKH